MFGRAILFSEVGSFYWFSSGISHWLRLLAESLKSKRLCKIIMSILLRLGLKFICFVMEYQKNIIGQGLVVSMVDDERKNDHAFVMVYVEKALIPSEKLRRPREGAKVIGEAIHKCIYWEFVDVCPKLDCILP
ncbi:hypothetical protein BUALT_Bualt02G0078600 [Buddleja alternifolia]|uniref:Uncharacterized protein n=1 Tax=Buddleja alternifolia TaxID=168488 RepID=A0AAV6Y534_9LAMI|nr:hypothetical protein BUALT_Bualt02G0078600 [Buddleja alternifolia]